MFLNEQLLTKKHNRAVITRQEKLRNDRKQKRRSLSRSSLSASLLRGGNKSTHKQSTGKLTNHQIAAAHDDRNRPFLNRSGTRVSTRRFNLEPCFLLCYYYSSPCETNVFAHTRTQVNVRKRRNGGRTAISSCVDRNVIVPEQTKKVRHVKQNHNSSLN